MASDDVHEYDCTITWKRERRAALALPNHPDVTISVGTPPEFGGHADVVSPEELYVASIGTCLLTTFFTLAAKRKLEYTAASVDAHGILERDERSRFWFSRVILRPSVTITDESKTKKATKTWELAEKLCLVSNSIRTEVELHPSVEVGSTGDDNDDGNDNNE